jgi:hypothetical protein
VAAFVVAMVSCVALVGVEPLHVGAAAAAGAYTPVGPCRLIDTRATQPLTVGGAIDIDVAGSCGVPTSAIAAVLTFTVTETAASGFLTAHPSDEPRPEASTLNWDAAGETRANTALLALSPNGSVRAWVSAGTHLVVDVTGAFVAAAAARAGRFVALAAQRLVDTRAAGTSTAPSAIAVTLPSDVPGDAVAVAANVTITATSGPAYLEAGPAGSPPTGTSFLNADGPGQTRAAAIIAAVSAGGFIVRLIGRGHIIVDITGFFTGPSAPSSADGLFVALTPKRLVDTRSSGPQLHPDGTREFAVDLPSGDQVAAIAANVTLTATDAPGWAVVYPARTARPPASSINTDRRRQTVANLAVTPVSTLGIAAYSSGGTDLILDVTGWFTGSPVTATDSGPPANLAPPALPGCTPSGRSAVADKAAQRFWLCEDGDAITEALPMTTGGLAYGLPPVGAYSVFAKVRVGRGIHGEPLNWFVPFYRTPRGNRIGFHEVVNQPPATVGDPGWRGASAGCFRVRRDDARSVWDFLQLGDKVVVITA